MNNITFDTNLCADPSIEAANLATLGGLPLPDLARANSLMNPLGRAPARGWFLLQATAFIPGFMDALHSVTFTDVLGNTVEVNGLVITREPQKVSYTMTTGQSSSCFLVEVSDARWLCHNPTYTTTINRMYNVIAPGWGGSYLANSLNAGVPWTWTLMVGDIWDQLPQLGAFPGSLPVSPGGTPESFIFPGTSAYLALTAVLDRIGCALQWNATANTYAVVQVGAADAVTATLLTTLYAQKRQIHDAEFQPITRGIVPAGCACLFHRREQDYGSEQTTPEDGTNWMTESVYQINVAGPALNAQPNTLHPLWGDLTAVYDTSNALLNLAALTAQANEIAGNYFLDLIQGGQRFFRRYSGVVPLSPGPMLKGVTWRGSGAEGIVTEVIRHPFARVKVADIPGHGVGFDWEDVEDSTNLHAPDFRQTWPVYPQVEQTLRINNSTPIAGLYDAKVQTLTTLPDTWTDREDVYAVDLAGAATLPTSGPNSQYPGRLVRSSGGKPVYRIRSGGATVYIWQQGRLYTSAVANPFVTLFPFEGNQSTLITSGVLKTYTIPDAGINLNVSGLSDGVYDVFATDTGSGSITLATVAWTSLNVRNHALATTMGMLVDSTNFAYKFLGTIYVLSGNAIDSPLTRYLSNYYNILSSYLSDGGANGVVTGGVASLSGGSGSNTWQVFSGLVNVSWVITGAIESPVCLSCEMDVIPNTGSSLCWFSISCNGTGPGLTFSEVAGTTRTVAPAGFPGMRSMVTTYLITSNVAGYNYAHPVVRMGIGNGCTFQAPAISGEIWY